MTSSTESDVLARICADKKIHVDRRKSMISVEALYEAIENKPAPEAL